MTVAVIPPATCTSDDPTQPDFWTGACVATHTGLVAYAPYSNNTSIGATLGMFTSTIGNNLYDSQATMDYSVKYVPILNPTTGAFYPASDTTNYGTVGKPSESQSSIDDPKRLARLDRLLNSGLSPQGYYGLWSVNGHTGVYLDNLGNDTYIKYNLAPLNLGNNFAIEMSVRGSALKRTSSAYFLFTLGDNTDTYNSNSIGFGIYSSQIQSMTKPSTSFQFTSFLSSSIINSSVLDTNLFYKVKISLNTISNQSQTCIGNSCGAWSNIGGYTSAKFRNAPYLYIASGSDKVYQWNDIIDSVKIYNN